MLSILRKSTHQLLSRLSTAIPTSCALCHAQSRDGICTHCHKQYFVTHLARCYQCANPLAGSPDHPLTRCGNCLKNPPAFDATIVAVDYAPPVDQLVQSFKFSANLALGPVFARLIWDAIHQDARQLPLPDVLSAVPLGLERLSKRGFNQAQEIAKPLSRFLAIPLDSQVAVRTRETEMQSAISHKKRQENMRKAFTVTQAGMARIQGQHVGIVDDVLTTGCTLNELAATLKRFGATRVTGIVFARTPP